MYWVHRTYISPEDKNKICDYYNQIAWQWRAVLTSGKGSSRDAVLRSFRALVGELEARYRAPLCCLMIPEGRGRGESLPEIGPHLNVTIASTAQIEQEAIVRGWNRLEGNGQSAKTADVERPDSGTLSYFFKLYGAPDFDYYEHRLELFTARRPDGWWKTHRGRRRFARQQNRISSSSVKVRR